MKRSRDKKNSKQTPQRRESARDDLPQKESSSGGGFEWKDRSGKVHRVGAPSHSHKVEAVAPRSPGFQRKPTLGRPPEDRAPRRKAQRDDRPRHPGYDPAPTPEAPRNRNPKNYGAQKPLLKFRGTVDKNRRGFGFISFDNRRMEDAFIPPREAEQLFHGDRVEVFVNEKGEVQDLQVVDHRFREMVGRFQPEGRGQNGWLVYERKNVREQVWIPGPNANVQPGDWIRAKLEFHADQRPNTSAKILEVYGKELPSTADIGMVSAEYNLVEAHSPQAVAEAEAFKLDVAAELKRGRVDLRELPLITIDGETARDFDDAVFVERNGDGYFLWVGIADVSHYVTDGSALDAEALSRGTSVYFPERAFHMLPRALSENLCSLVPNQPRLAMVAKMGFDSKGSRTSVEVMEALINSHRRATYTEIQKETEENKSNPNWEYTPHLELYRLIRKARTQRGSIDFDLPEAEIRVDTSGFPISILERPRQDSHRLIEEFMIAANEAVTAWMKERDWPFLYRVHDEPSEMAIHRFQKLASTQGVHFSYEAGSLHLVIPELIERLEGHAAQTLLNMALLRSMKQAMYSAEYGRHFGLASPGYTHFTSPIRRYPDLIVHRLIRWALYIDQKKIGILSNEDRGQLQKKLDQVAEHCSYRERIASDAERESIRLKQIRIMQPHLGDEFDGKVNGMNDNGMFIKLGNPFVEGMLPKDSLTDDSYEFNEERLIFYGKRKKRTFKVGSPVRVRVARADIDQRMLDFALVGAGDEPEPHMRDGRKERQKPKHSEKNSDRKSSRSRRS